MNFEGPLNILVCGTKFGAMYLRAVAQDPHMTLTGIISRGSEQSRRLASIYNVALSTSADDIPTSSKDKTSIAVIAIRSSVVGGSGGVVAKAIMDAGYDVLIEPPVHHNELAELIATARKKKRRISVANMYRSVLHVDSFLTAFLATAAVQKPLLVEIATSFHMVSHLPGIIACMAPGSALRIDGSSGMGPFRHIDARVGSLPLSILVHNEIDSTAPDAHAHAILRLDAHFPSGTIHLAEAGGPLLWIPSMEIVNYTETGLPLSPKSIHPIEHLAEEDNQNYSSWMERTWTSAISHEIHSFAHVAANGKDAAADLLAAKNWSTLVNTIGYPNQTTFTAEQSSMVPTIKNALEIRRADRVRRYLD